MPAHQNLSGSSSLTYDSHQSLIEADLYKYELAEKTVVSLAREPDAQSKHMTFLVHSNQPDTSKFTLAEWQAFRRCVVGLMVEEKVARLQTTWYGKSLARLNVHHSLASEIEHIFQLKLDPANAITEIEKLYLHAIGRRVDIHVRENFVRHDQQAKLNLSREQARMKTYEDFYNLHYKWELYPQNHLYITQDIHDPLELLNAHREFAGARFDDHSSDFHFVNPQERKVARDVHITWSMQPPHHSWTTHKWASQSLE